MDVVSALGAVVHSGWLLPVLVVMIAVDAPFPVLPSETLLMTAAAVAFADDDLVVVTGLFVAAVLGSVAGDLVTFCLGRSSHRIVAVRDGGGGARWVRRHLLRRPGLALVGARFVPGGRLVSTAAAGRFGLSLRRFVPWSVVSSAAWGAYMVGVGRVLEPMTGGNPLLCVVGGTVLAVLTGALFALAQVVRRRAVRVTAGGSEGIDRCRQRLPVPPAPVMRSTDPGTAGCGRFSLSVERTITIGDRSIDG